MALNLGQFTVEANLGSLQTGARFYIWDGSLTGIDRSVYTDWGSLSTYFSASSTLEGLTDTNITSPTGETLLRYDSGNSEWVDETAEELGLSRAPNMAKDRRIVGTTINISGQYTQIVYSNSITYDFTYNGDGTINTKSDGTTTWQAVYSSGEFSNWNVI